MEELRNRPQRKAHRESPVSTSLEVVPFLSGLGLLQSGTWDAGCRVGVNRQMGSLGMRASEQLQDVAHVAQHGRLLPPEPLLL